MGALVGMWISASLVPLELLRNFLGAVKHDRREWERDDRRMAEMEREAEIEALERRLAELRRC
jgi:hypothetical protein